MSRVVLFGALVFVVAGVISLQRVRGSCDNKECVVSSCWKIPLGVYIEYNYASALVEYANEGGGTPRDVTPTVSLVQKTRAMGTADCPGQETSKASQCSGDSGMPSPAGVKRYCSYAT